VRVSVDVESREESAVRLHYAVADTGPGIPPAQRESIFAPFTQADSSTTRRFGGTGLGLAISARLVQLMDGRIWLEPRPGMSGSVFHFTVRLGLADITATTPCKAGPDHAPGACTNLRILVAEDNPVNQILVSRLLERDGHRVTLARNGKEALSLFRGQSFDLIVMDVDMPDMDGLETTAAIRASEKSNGSHVPILAMTAHAMKGDEQRCLAAGMDSYVAKPIRPEDLMKRIATLVQQFPQP
ncbi:MAG TPA: response regulator, partial [Bryobacteraceae bacterium]|nr:response regulator [Bryobacteraceae bacterium]